MSSLYWIDVNEEKLKNELKTAENNETARATIARVVIDRLQQKQEKKMCATK